MRTVDLYDKKTVLSFEIFPPKKNLEGIYSKLDSFKKLNPDFISVTCGAGGTGLTDNTLTIAKTIKEDYGIESAIHLPIINLTKEAVEESLIEFREAGIENIIALRGDENPNFKPVGEFQYASDLVSFIHERGDFNVMGACYPEGHFEAKSIDCDIENLKKKVDAGTSQLISQLFYDNAYFYDFKERADRAGIDVPIEAGIMPAINKNQIERMVKMCDSKLPSKFKKIFGKYEDHPESIKAAGIAYAIDQITDLFAQGVDGVHLYTMNNPEVTEEIVNAVKPILEAENAVKVIG